MTTSAGIKLTEEEVSVQGVTHQVQVQVPGSGERRQHYRGIHPRRRFLNGKAQQSVDHNQPPSRHTRERS
jgi:hypothetical protein